MSMNTTFLRVLAVFALFASFSSPAYAYLDPATGSIIVQSVIGAVAGFVMYSKLFASRVRNFFARLGSGRSKTDAE